MAPHGPRRRQRTTLYTRDSRPCARPWEGRPPRSDEERNAHSSSPSIARGCGCWCCCRGRGGRGRDRGRGVVGGRGGGRRLGEGEKEETRVLGPVLQSVLWSAGEQVHALYLHRTASCSVLLSRFDTLFDGQLEFRTRPGEVRTPCM